MESIAVNKQSSVLDVAKIREDFPILQERIHEKPLVYLDNAATTQKPVQVLEKLNSYYRESNANVHRALHTLADKATSGYEQARSKAAGFIHANSAKEIVFTRGTTESINLVAHSYARKFLQSGDEIILSQMEHHSNIVPWHLLAKDKGVTIKFIPLTDAGCLDISQLEKLVTSRTRMISVVHMSNVLGTINPVKEICEFAHSKNIKVLIDAAQSVPGMPVNVQDIGCDFLAFSSHKMVGPTGIGVLYGREEILEAMNPFMGGGEMIGEVTLEGSTWAELPHKFEAGTPNIADAFGLEAAFDYLTVIGMENIKKYKQELTGYAIKAMETVSGIRILGDAPERGSVISFVLEKIHPFDLAQYLDQYGIAIRSGHHCAQPLINRFSLNATARASLYFYNTFEEIDYFVDKLNLARNIFS